MAVDKHEIFRLASEILPEERKRQFMKVIQGLRGQLNDLIGKVGGESDGVRTDELIQQYKEELRAAMEKLKAEFGEETRVQLIKVLSEYSIEEQSQWFAEGFRETEMKLFSSIFDELRAVFAPKGKELLRTRDLVIDDRGMGTGRTLKMLLEIVEAQATERKKREYFKGKDRSGGGGVILTPQEEAKTRTFALREAQNFANNLYGVDLIKGNVQKAFENLDRYQIPRRNLVVGDYLAPSEGRISSPTGKAHLIVCMMHSIFHCTTEQDLVDFFQRVKEDLLPGGLFVFDTVLMRRSQPSDFEDAEAQKKLYDLMNFYTMMWVKYCRDNKRFGDEKRVDLLSLPRYPIFDSPNGKGFVWREVSHFPYVDYIIGKIGGGLVQVRNMGANPKIENEEKARELGLGWIRSNGLLEEFRTFIADRVRTGFINPSELLRRPMEESEAKSEAILEELLGYVAYHMVRGYFNQYLVYRRTD
jgi:hypothetical protein